MAVATRISDGCSISHTPTAAVSAGGVVVQEDLIGIATEAIPADTLGALQIEGIFKIKKDESTAVAVGDIVYWDVADQEVQDTSDTGTNKQIGKVVEAAASDATHCLVKLIP